MELGACACGRFGVSGMSHRPSDMLRWPVIMMFLIFVQHLKEFFVKNGLIVIITWLPNLY